MSSSGAKLREVGTTNKTRATDYESVIGEETAALMKVHSSNYVICGFTESASISELVSIGKKNRVPVIDDVGSGALVDFSKYGSNESKGTSVIELVKLLIFDDLSSVIYLVTGQLNHHQLLIQIQSYTMIRQKLKIGQHYTRR